MDPIERLSSLGQFRMRLGLNRMDRTMEKLGMPQLQIPSVHVAGTNGKGSTCHMMDSIVSTFPVSRALYVSPHLIRVHERMVYDGSEVEDEELRSILGEIFEIGKSLFDPDDMPTYFETLTTAFFELSRRRGSDLNIVEVGMGGRFDATNILEPQAICITSISLDHIEHLGDEEHSIAREKAGIIRPSTPVVLGPIHRGDAGTRSLGAILDICTSNGCPVIIAAPVEDVDLLGEMMRSRSIPDGRIISVEQAEGDDDDKVVLRSIPFRDGGSFEDRLSILDGVIDGCFDSPLHGNMQMFNMACAVSLSLLSIPAAFSHMRLSKGEKGALLDLIEGSTVSLRSRYNDDELASMIKTGLARTRITGRCELLNNGDPDIVFDGGHNREAASLFAKNIRRMFRNRKGVLLLAMMEEKDPGTYIETMGDVISTVIVTRVDLDRSKDVRTLLKEISSENLGDFDIHVRDDIDQALNEWMVLSKKNGLGIAGGSFYLYQPVVERIKRPI